MNLPFTVEQFLGVFQSYNESVWPMQVVLVMLAAASIYLAVKSKPYSAKLIPLLLAFLWLWMGIVYHLTFFSSINEAARIFGVMFIVQGILFTWFGVVQPSLSFRFRPDTIGVSGIVLLAYALVVYPILGVFFGHSYPKSPTFGLPCPTTIFTYGMLLWSDKVVPVALLIVPLLWSVIGYGAAGSLGMKEDYGLILATFVALPFILKRNRMLESGEKHA